MHRVTHDHALLGYVVEDRLLGVVGQTAICILWQHLLLFEVRYELNSAISLTHFFAGRLVVLCLSTSLAITYSLGVGLFVKYYLFVKGHQALSAFLLATGRLERPLERHFGLLARLLRDPID